jgi:DNA-directed RNA polymerase subunit RPC12/RpoP
MPRIVYACGHCAAITKKFYKSSSNIKDNIECVCGERMVRHLSSPSQKSKIVVDNGVQAKATELDRNIVEIIEDREEAQLKQRGDSVLENLK